MAIDRRVSRTRNALYEAISTLMLTRPYAEIEVQDITAHANVGRSTFYTHFRSKDELLVRSLERLRPFLAEGRQAQLRTPRIGSCEGTLALFRQVANHRPLLDAIDGTPARDMVVQAIVSELGRFLSPYAARPSLAAMPRDLGLHFVTGTFASVLSWWLKSAPEISPEEVDRLFHQLVDRGIPADFFSDDARRAA